MGLLLGVLFGIGQTGFLYFSESYSTAEIQLTVLNLLSHSLYKALLLSMPLGLVFAIGWIFYNRLEHLLWVGGIVGLIFLPIVYYVNKLYLPGIRDPKSILGNGVLALVALMVFVVIYRRWRGEIRLVHCITNRYLVGAALLLIGGAALGAWLQPDYRKLGDRQMELADFIDLPAMNGSGDSQTAIHNYLESKAKERLAGFRKRLAEQDPDTLLTIADSILARKLTFVGITREMPEVIDWSRNPTRDRVWLFALNRHEWLWDLAAAYDLTGNPAYAKAFEKHLTSWFEQMPPITWKDESHPAWRLMETSLRITTCWLDAFGVFYPSPDVSESLKLRMVSAFQEHGQFLLHFRSPGRNHLLQESFGLLALAGAFPEFKMSADWLRIADARLTRILQTEIYPDGGYNELSIFYHRFVIRILQQIADFVSDNHVQLSGFFYEQLENMYAFLMYVSRPDGAMPQVNDGFHAKDVRLLFDAPAAMFSRPDFRYLASNGLDGREPDQRSIGFPYSGLYILRSDWQADARYMLLDAGLFGSAHGHEDKLSFEAFAFGRPFIVESGTYTYRFDKWHRYFESSFAHNTVVVDGRSQLRLPNESTWASDPPAKLDNLWLSEDVFDYAEGSYGDGYGNRKEDVISGIEHRRGVLFVKPDYWIVWDRISGEGEHSVEQLFHLAPDLHAQELDSTALAISYPDGPKMYLSTHGTVLPDRKIVSGREDPVQGWVSPEYGVKVAAPVVISRMSGGLPLSFVTLLFPVANDSGSITPAMERIPVMSGEVQLSLSDAVALKIAHAGGEDYILIAPSVAGMKIYADFETNARLQIMRTDGGEVISEVEIHDF